MRGQPTPEHSFSDVPEKPSNHQSVSRRTRRIYKTNPIRESCRFATILVEIVEPPPVVYFRQIDTAHRGEVSFFRYFNGNNGAAPGASYFSSIAPPPAARSRRRPRN